MRAYEKIKGFIHNTVGHPAFQMGALLIFMTLTIFIMYIVEVNNHESDTNDSNVSVVTSTIMSQPTTTRSTTPITDEVTTSVSETQSSVSTTQETTTSTTTTTPVVTTKKKVTTVATTKVVPVTEPEPVITEPVIEETPPSEEVPSIDNPEESTPVNTSGRPVIYDCTLSDDVQQYIYDKCKEYGVPYELIMAIMKKESTFRPGAKNGPCVGLMQLNINYNSATASALGVSLYDAKGNALVGIIAVSNLLSKYSIHDALMCYNMGEFGAKKYLGGSTSYSRKVVQYYNEYLGK